MESEQRTQAKDVYQFNSFNKNYFYRFRKVSSLKRERMKMFIFTFGIYRLDIFPILKIVMWIHQIKYQFFARLSLWQIWNTILHILFAKINFVNVFLLEKLCIIKTQRVEYIHKYLLKCFKIKLPKKFQAPKNF